MKYIRKGAAPRELTAWFEGQPVEDGKKINCRYKNIEPEVKRIVEDRLLAEQGWICCYTGMSIDGGDFHIEHVIPQSESKLNGTHEDVDFQNMLAAYPKRNECPFGARKRENKPLRITPLQPSCETKFRFDLDGNISGVDQDAQDTIICLALDHDWLTEMRKAAIDEVLFSARHPLSEAKARIVAEQYCSTNASGKYPRFCFVVAQAAQEYLRKIGRQRKRKQAIQRQAKKR